MSDSVGLGPAELRGLKLGHLRLMAELQSTPQLTLAAARLGLSQPAASRLLAEVERIVGQPLHKRQGRSLTLTEVGAALARRAGRIALELADALRDMAEAAGGTVGALCIGSVTGPALNLLLPALTAAQRAYPGLQAEVIIATSEVLCDHVRSGRCDFALGRPQGNDGLLTTAMFGEESLGLFVRRGHPLLSKPDLQARDLFDHDWVMPEPATLLTRSVLARLAELHLPDPSRRLATGSNLFTLAMLNATDAIAPLPRAVAASLSVSAPAAFVELPLDLGLGVPPFGLIRRAATELTPTAQRLAARIEALALSA